MAQRRRRNRKWLWWGVGVILVAVLVAVGVSMGQGSSDGSRGDDQAESSESEEEVAGEGMATNESEDLDVETAEKKKVVQYEGDDPNEAEELTGVVTYAGVNSGSLMIRVSIDQYLVNGTCELTLERSGAIIYSSIANIVGDVAAATCEGFDVPVGELGGGEIGININLSADGRRGTIRGEASI